MTYIGPDGRRVTTESAYLTPEVLARPNLRVASHATVTKIRFETREVNSVQTPRAVAVEFVNPRGEKFKVKVRKEAILACVTLLFSGDVSADFVRRLQNRFITHSTATHVVWCRTRGSACTTPNSSSC